MIVVICPHCGRELSIPEQYAGQTGKCRHCEKMIAVPELAILSDTSTSGDVIQDAVEKALASAEERKKITTAEEVGNALKLAGQSMQTVGGMGMQFFGCLAVILIVLFLLFFLFAP